MAEDAAIRNVTMACLGCGYALDALPLPRCPECGRTFDPADPATFVGLTPPQPRTWRQYFASIGLITALLLVLSMGHYRAGITRGRDPQQDAPTMGAPLPWLRCPPDGVEVVWPRLALALACFVALAVGIDSLSQLTRRWFPLWRPQHLARTVVLSALAGAAAGYYMTADMSIGLALVEIVLPFTLLVFAWRSQDLGLVLLTAMAAALGYRWALRMSFLFIRRPLFSDGSLRGIFAWPMGRWAIYVALLLFITWLRRAFAKPTPPPTFGSID